MAVPPEEAKKRLKELYEKLVEFRKAFAPEIEAAEARIKELKEAIKKKEEELSALRAELRDWETILGRFRVPETVAPVPAVVAPKGELTKKVAEYLKTLPIGSEVTHTKVAKALGIDESTAYGALKRFEKYGYLKKVKVGWSLERHPE